MCQPHTPNFTPCKINRQPWMNDQQYDWALQEELSRVNTLRRLHEGEGKILIAIKAQHPLNPDGTPGPEYTTRLNEALELMHIMTELYDYHKSKFKFMTFGGIHDGHATMTLAEAGANWLKTNGIPEDSIIVHNQIFSGNDEDDLAAQEFANDADYSELHVVMSAGQYDRSRFYFMSTGWQPFLHPIPYLDGVPNHSSLCEFSGTYSSSARMLVENGLENAIHSAEETRQRHLAEAKAFQEKQTPDAT